MPIRTNRGRAAVYRRLWGWPLRSPKHLIAAIVLVAGLATGIGLLLPDAANKVLPGRGSGGTPAPATTTHRPQAGGSVSPTTPTGPPPTRLSSPQAAPSPADPAPEALSVAESWVRAWATHPAGITSQQWLDGLRPFTTEEFLPVMASVDPANVPATTVTGPVTSKNSTASSLEVSVPTDGGLVLVTVISVPQQGWRVAGFSKGA